MFNSNTSKEADESIWVPCLSQIQSKMMPHACNKKICFVGLDNYPIINPDRSELYIGGESVQQTLLARAFRDAGFTVSMIVKDFGQEQGECIDNINVWKTFAQEDGLPVLRYFHPRISSIWKALHLADAGIYYQSCAGMLTGIVAAFCQRYGRRFVFRVAHDTDCIPGEQLIHIWRDRKIYEFGLRRADLIASQGAHQVTLLKKHYGLSSVSINMAVEAPSTEQQRNRDIDVLWINNIRDFKKPELVLELAEYLPEINFTMIGGKVLGHEELFSHITEEAESRSNLNFLGALPYHEVNEYISRAKVFINTSDTEGFPNSFLQSWIRCVPVISFFDPDGLIKSENLGIVPSDLKGMGESIRQILANETNRLAIGELAAKYTKLNYGAGAVTEKYVALLDGKRSRDKGTTHVD